MINRTLTMIRLPAMARLLRLPLALMVALTALAGALARGVPLSGLCLWTLGCGIFLLAAASSVLNQVQERGSDALMRRTCQRPLASGALSPRAGMAIGVALGSGGLVVLAVGFGPAPALLALAALAWYLLAYTPLKRVSSLAVLAGTPCGAVPPLLGWLAAGGNLPAPQPLALALFMLLWQVPHYWLLALPDRNDLKTAGFRVLPELSDRQLLAVTHRWLLGLALITLLLPALDLPSSPFLQGILVGSSLTMAGAASWVLHRGLFATHVVRQLCRLLHLYLGLVLLILLLDCPG